MGCLGIKMPKLRYEQDCSSPSPISHDKEIRAVLIAAERGTEHTALSMRVHASHLTPWKMWYFCSKFLRNLELHRVLWGSGVSFRKTGGNVFPEAIINKQLHQIVVIRHPSRLKNHREKSVSLMSLLREEGCWQGSPHCHQFVSLSCCPAGTSCILPLTPSLSWHLTAYLCLHAASFW